MDLSISGIALALLFSIVGITAWRYGKAQSSARHMMLGVGLMAYGYFVDNLWVNLAVGCGLTFFLFFP